MIFDNVIEVVVNYFHWEPAVIGGLNFDRDNFNGLLYWFDFVKKVNKKQK